MEKLFFIFVKNCKMCTCILNHFQTLPKLSTFPHPSAHHTHNGPSNLISLESEQHLKYDFHTLLLLFPSLSLCERLALYSALMQITIRHSRGQDTYRVATKNHTNGTITSLILKKSNGYRLF